MANLNPYVTDTRSRVQQRYAERQEKKREAQRLADLEVCLQIPEARRFIWSLLEDCGMYQNIYTPNGNEIYFLAGKQDLGHELVARLELIDPRAVYEIGLEAATLRKRINAATEASQTPPEGVEADVTVDPLQEDTDD